MDDKLKYRNLCESSKEIPLFSQDWWLDAVVGAENWDVIVIEKDGIVQASHPYIKKYRLGFLYIVQPKLTQTLGPWIRKIDNIKHEAKLKQEKELLQEIVTKLPKFSVYNQCWNHTNSNWLPFYWLGFEQTTKYTYKINKLDSYDTLWKNLAYRIKSEINKAKNKHFIKIVESTDVEELIYIHKKTFERQGLKLPYEDKLIRNIYKKTSIRNASKIFLAKDNKGNIHSGVFLVYDQKCTYYLIGGTDILYRKSGANSLCIWEAIKFSSNVSSSFDFEGSMIESIEFFFRGFGAEQEQYFNIYKTNSKIITLLKMIKKIFTK
jgi:lipid II:glycine glycyltransferase (peptidoglycan interpeptide bridge formation enzyme)